MNTILGFKNLEEEEFEDHPCSENLRTEMLDFHESLSRVIAIGSLEEDEEEGLTDFAAEDAKPNVWKTILQVSFPAIRVSQAAEIVFFCFRPFAPQAKETKTKIRRTRRS